MADILYDLFKSVIDQDDCPVVICNLFNEIVYMNPSAIEHYSDDIPGDYKGRLITDCHPRSANEHIDAVVKWFMSSMENNVVHTSFNKAQNKDVYMVALRCGNGELIGYYERHIYRTADSEGFYRMG